MEWTVIDKNRTQRPRNVSKYGDYKLYLRLEAKEKCVYCAIHENPLGGSDHFHVEHYKPKSKPQFSSLEKDFNNLFYACAICNRFKGADWPNDPIADHSVVSYPNPKDIDYNELFSIDEKGKIEGKFVASKYMVERIFLNRPQLINERREYFIRAKSMEALQRIERQLNGLKLKKGESRAFDLLGDFGALKTEIISLLHREREISKYRPSEIKRSKK